MTDSPRITINDIRACGFCVWGTKDWFSLHGMDFRDFLANGAPVATFEALDDDYARAIVAKHEERVGG